MVFIDGEFFEVHSENFEGRIQPERSSNGQNVPQMAGTLPRFFPNVLFFAFFRPSQLPDLGGVRSKSLNTKYLNLNITVKQ